MTTFMGPEPVVAPWTDEDRAVIQFRRLHAARHGSNFYAELARSMDGDRRDARIMHWIASQQAYAYRQERRYGRGGRLASVHPLARIGMGFPTRQ
jgi:hypothetical protein